MKIKTLWLVCKIPLLPKRSVVLIFFIAVNALAKVYAADTNNADVQFNTDVLDIKERSQVELDRFSRPGYLMPGDYQFKIRINKNELDTETIHVYGNRNDNDEKFCISSDVVQKIDFHSGYLDKIASFHNGECMDLTSLKGVTLTPDLGSGLLQINIPQAFLEYSSPDWVPSSMWDTGVPGMLFDYNLNATEKKNQSSDSSGQEREVSGNGVLGANLGAWRARADWQLDAHNGGDGGSGMQTWQWSRFYLFRPLTKIDAKLSLGEDYTNSALFDSIRYTGASLESDSTMLPPNLRGYAPEITGVAKTNAKVTVSQQGRVIYETQVPAGPFRIQELSNSVSGQLDVKVSEQDGSVQTFQVSTATIPYLSRPGSVRYKIFAGQPSDWQHHTDGSAFGSGEFSWGISNGWSLYGGLLASSGYQAETVGVGRDLLIMGALAFDVSRSQADISSTNYSGNSYRLSYSKRFDDTGSEVTFAGYRFSEKTYVGYSDYVDYHDNDELTDQDKEMYTITFSQQFSRIGLSAYLSYEHRTYWNSPAEDNYNLSLSRYFDIGKMKNIDLSLNLYRDLNDGDDDRGMYLSVSVPWGENDSVGYNGSSSNGHYSNNISYYGRPDLQRNYQLGAGYGSGDSHFNGYYDYLGSLAEVSANAAYQSGEYISVGSSVKGGVTATAEGIVAHRVGVMGGTRMMVDTDGINNIPVQGNGADIYSNRFGKAVITEVNSYNKNQIKVDVNALPDNAESVNSVIQKTLTEGAIGYAKFDVISGLKAMAVIRLADGSFPPFGAEVTDSEAHQVGILSDDGEVYLSGIRPDAIMSVALGDNKKCNIQIPPKLPEVKQGEFQHLLLPCR
ncbi:outer membrane usher protein [Salmonella enterica]|nr:outer membrane usher protein [Salmonella enterica]